VTGIRFVDPPGRGLRRRPLDPGLLALLGAALAVLLLLFLIAMLERGLGVTLGDLLGSPPPPIEAKQTSSQDSTSVL